MNRPVLVFEVQERLCGVDAADVLEVVRSVAIEPLAGAPRGVEGVIDARGEILPVIGMRTRLGLDFVPNDPSQFLILARAGARQVALRVDRVHDLRPLEVTARETMGLDDVPAVGVARFSDGLIFIHDLEACLDASEEQLLAALLAERQDREGGPPTPSDRGAASSPEPAREPSNEDEARTGG